MLDTKHPTTLRAAEKYFSCSELYLKFFHGVVVAADALRCDDTEDVPMILETCCSDGAELKEEANPAFDHISMLLTFSRLLIQHNLKANHQPFLSFFTLFT